MYRGRKVAISIPAYNEEALISKTITTLPSFVDLAIVVDDASSDRTASVVEALADPRVRLERNERNQGVGFSVVRGFKRALQESADIVCIMPGDAQCDPAYLHRLIDEVVEDRCDYAKANRFIGHPHQLRSMPAFRRIGNVLLTLLNKFATGYYSIFDTQNSYSAIEAETLRRMDLEAISPRYEFDNSYLLQLALINARIHDVPVPAIYGEETSTIKLVPFVSRTLGVVTAGFVRRIYVRYVVYSFHPVALFLFAGALLMLWGVVFGLWVVINTLGPPVASTGTVMLSVLPFLMGFQLVLAGIVLDIFNEPR